MDFEQLLRETIGLDAGSIGSSTIDRAIRRRVAETGISSLEDYWISVKTSKEELQELVESVVVPETWFFRDPEAFSCLVRLAREKCLTVPGKRPFRVLSVPCSTGEEPYSIAMALLDGGFSSDMFRVDAVDISIRALARARAGDYGSNSFRGNDLAWRERWFRSTARGYSISEAPRNQVRFRQGNLLTSDLKTDADPYDAIFCRNLLIYFDQLTQERIMALLHPLLCADGFLFVGASETYLASRSGFSAIRHPMAFAFRKGEGGVSESSLPPLQRTAPPPKFSLAPPVAPVPKPKAAPPVPIAKAIDPAAIQRLADAGNLREAVEQCERHVRQSPSSPGAWYLLGVLKEALGDSQSALDCYRKLLYLDPEHVEAMSHMALLIERHGDPEGAARTRERVRRIELRRKKAALPQR
ncbi:MAG TPA: CheR family methyltransferase [Bryobacteraceae bacterium]|nr:CheR family methyltransferase [Bryobacteraceae bacterium]